MRFNNNALEVRQGEVDGREERRGEKEAVTRRPRGREEEEVVVVEEVNLEQTQTHRYTDTQTQTHRHTHSLDLATRHHTMP